MYFRLKLPLGFSDDGVSVTTNQKASNLAQIQIASAFELSSQPMLMIDVNGVIAWCNSSYAKNINQPKWSIIGNKPYFMNDLFANKIDIQDIDKNTGIDPNWAVEVEYQNTYSGLPNTYQTIFTRVSEEDQSQCAYFIIQNDITLQKQQCNSLYKMANHDRLTGLPNRTMFATVLEHSLHQAKRQSTQSHLMMLDLDGFKKVNDKYGHSAGDYVLIEVGKRIQSIIRDSDFVARLGGDEFGIILMNIIKDEDAKIIASKLIASINKNIIYKSNILSVGASIGIAKYPKDAKNEGELQDKADAAMYEAKKLGKNIAIAFSNTESLKRPVITAEIEIEQIQTIAG